MTTHSSQVTIDDLAESTPQDTDGHSENESTLQIESEAKPADSTVHSSIHTEWADGRVPLDTLEEKIVRGKISVTQWNLSNKKITSAHIPRIVAILMAHPEITTLDLENNEIGDTHLELLASNKTLKVLRLKKGNRRITDRGLNPFLENDTLIAFPLSSGTKQYTDPIRAKIKKNVAAHKEKQKAAYPYKDKQEAAKALLKDLNKQAEHDYVGLQSLLEDCWITDKPLQRLEKKTFLPNRYSREHYESKKAAYLNAHRTTKKKQGEENFLELASWFLIDLMQYSDTSDGLTPMMAILINMFVHNSSYAPAQGFGKAQQREIEKMLFYYRSQYDTHQLPLYHELVKHHQTGKTLPFLPRNAAFIRMLKHVSLNPVFTKKLGSLDTFGYMKEGVKSEHFGEMLAYTGARKNNFSTFLMALKTFGIKNGGNGSTENFQAWIKERVKLTLPEHQQALTDTDIANLRENVKTNLCELRKGTNTLKPISGMSRKMLTIRVDRAETLCRNLANLAHIDLEHPNNSSILVLKLYPGITGDQRESQNYGQGLTSVLLGFFTGLLNHYASQRGLPIFAQRRQSFGFLSPTLTDAGGLNIRVSLGLEPSIYDEVLSDAIVGFSRLLDEFNFVTKTNSLVKQCFSPSEKPRQNGVNEKTGTYLLSSTRSEPCKWVATLAAQQYLKNASENTSTPSESAAFKLYLQDFILRRSAKDIAKGKSVNLDDLQFKAYHFQPKLTETVVTTEERPIVFDLLTNILCYALEQTHQMELLGNALEAIQLKRTYWHTLQKLYSNCLKASWLLEDLNPSNMVYRYHAASLLIENLQEYLILLTGIAHINKTKAEQEVSIQTLKTTEKTYLSRKLGFTANNMEVYYTDSGQQAIITALIAMELQFYGKPKEEGGLSDRNIYAFSNSYYELDKFFNDIGGIDTNNKNAATVAFIDVTQLDQLNIDEFPNLKAVVIDVTHNTNFTDDKISQTIKRIRSSGKFIVLASSTLKQEEMGLDKYQSGRIVVIPPEGQELESHVVEDLDAISKEAMDPFVASYLQLTQAIYTEKHHQPEQAYTQVARQLATFGLMSHKQLREPDEQRNLQLVPNV